MRKHINERADGGGFTLVELLITIVVVGVLTAIAIVGITSLTKNGTDAACHASLDAAKAATTAHKANSGSYPQAFTDMTSTNPRELEVPAGVALAATTLTKGTDWTLTLQPHGPNSVTTYACS